MPLSGAPPLGVVALSGAVGVVVVVAGVVSVVVVVRCVVDGAFAPESLWLWLSEPQAPSARAAAIAMADAIRFIDLMIAKRADGLATLPANCALRVLRLRP
jgi:hypothetical protein